MKLSFLCKRDFSLRPVAQKGPVGQRLLSCPGSRGLKGWVGSYSGFQADRRSGRVLSPAAPVPTSLSSLQKRRAVVGGAGSQEWSVCICVRGWVSHRHRCRVGGSGEREKTGRIRTKQDLWRRLSPNKNSRSHPSHFRYPYPRN